MDIDNNEVSAELIEMIELQRQQEKDKADKKQERLQLLGAYVGKIRDEAVKKRRTCGIETIWDEDDSYYEGIDQFNKSETAHTKPRSDTGGVQSNRGGGKKKNQCTVFFPLTAPFVDAASARMGDILLPAGDWNWGVKKSPVSDSVELDVQIDEYDKQIAERRKAEETRIKDWLVAARYHAENRKVIESSARLGTGVLKGPFPTLRAIKTFSQGQLVVQEEIVPTSKAISVRDFFPDLNCGEDIQEGDYVFERDYLSAKKIQELANIDGYIGTAINQVLNEGPGKRYGDASNPEKSKESDLFEVWYYTGNIDVNDLDLIGETDPNQDDATDGYQAEGQELDEDNKDYQSVVLVLINDTVIKGHVNPLDNGEFPYDVMCWQRREGLPFGIGVGRQGRTAQTLLLSGGRALVDNMAISAIPMLAMRKRGLTPQDGKWEIKKGKVWWLTDDSIKAIGEAMQFMLIPSLQKELMAVMELASAMFEDATGINFLLQGQQGSAPDTVGGMQLLHQNASSLLRRVARVYDENITEPHIRRYHDWHLIYGDDEEKGDLEIEAIGSSALVEREIQSMQMQLILQIAQDPQSGYSVKKTADEMVRAMHLEPSRFEMDDEEKKAKSEEQPPQDPRIQVAQMKAETDMQIAQMREEFALQRVQEDTDRDTVHVQSQAAREDAQQQYLLEKMAIDERLAVLKHATAQQISLEKAKADLAKTAMTLQVQKEMAANNTKSQQVAKPLVEPVGRAKDGMAFQQ